MANNVAQCFSWPNFTGFQGGAEDLMLTWVLDTSVFGSTIDCYLGMVLLIGGAPCTWRLRMGGTYGLTDGTVLVSDVVSEVNPNTDVVGSNVSFANPGGVALMKLTGEGVGSSYSFQYLSAFFKG